MENPEQHPPRRHRHPRLVRRRPAPSLAPGRSLRVVPPHLGPGRRFGCVTPAHIPPPELTRFQQPSRTRNIYPMGISAPMGTFATSRSPGTQRRLRPVLPRPDSARLLGFLQQVGHGEVQVPGDAFEPINAPGDFARISQRHRRARHPQNLRQICLRAPTLPALRRTFPAQCCRRLLPPRPAGRARLRIVKRPPLVSLACLLEVLAALNMPPGH